MVDIQRVLVLVVVGGSRISRFANRDLRGIGDRKIDLRAGDGEMTIRKLEVEQCERNRVDIRAVTGHLRSARGSRIAAVLCPESCCRSVRCELRKHRRYLAAFTVARSQTLVGPKEESLVAPDRSADCAAVLILLEDWPRLVGSLRKEVVGIENVVAQKLPHRAVNMITPRSADHVDICARSPSVARIVVSCLHLEFQNGIRRWSCYAYFFNVVGR